MNAAAPLLKVDGLSVSIHGRPILDAVSLKADAGQVLAIVGESGSGKSMTAGAILRLLPDRAAWSGQMAFSGEALETKSETAMCRIRGRDIAMVFQEPMTALNPVRTIGDQVAETIRIHTKTRRADAMRAARQTLERVGLPDAQCPSSRFPHELSGGQRQRVVIAMAIALGPKLLIADEPTTALDVTTQAQILALLKRLVNEDGMGLILITHDLAVVAGMADRIAIMHEGAIVEDREAVAVLRAPRHPHTRALLAAAMPASRKLATHIDHAAPAVLSAQDIVRDYALPRRSLLSKPHRVRAVDRVSLAVRRGENVGLVGESGCGKSTLARAVLALDRLQGGMVSIDGSPFTSTDSQPGLNQRRRVQGVFQDPYSSFNPRHTVARLVGEPFHLDADAPSGAERRNRIERMLESVGLHRSDADRYIHEFSGGQRQRIAIARALIAEPALIVLDEAVSALDVIVRATILDLLADLSRRHAVSCLFIAHDLSVVRAVTDRVLVMKAGAIVEEGPTETVFSRPRHPYTKSLVAAAPGIERALQGRKPRR